MIRFTRIQDTTLPTAGRRVAEVQALFRRVFTAVAEYADTLPERLGRHDPKQDLFLLTAEDERGRVIGFALTLVFRDLKYAFLDYIASDPEQRHRGIGGALYEALREELARHGLKGLLMDVPPDDPDKVSDPARLPANRARLSFYERYGALPVVGTAYDDPPPYGQDYDPPFLVFDGLGHRARFGRTEARRVVEAILVRKCGWSPDDPYVRAVVGSFKDDPVRLRPFQYETPESHRTTRAEHGRVRPLKIVSSDQHAIHHVRERGYIERPARVDRLRRALEGLPVEAVETRAADEAAIRAVHHADFVDYLNELTTVLGPDETLYPYVFPIRRPDRLPRDPLRRAGYYCIDTFTPLSRAALTAARAAVDCAVTGADLLIEGERLVYALCRPPGHHAEPDVFGGFCYFNNAAIAAHRLSAQGRVALVDIDFHHGNGSQQIFYDRDDVYFASLHGDPTWAYPYFSGFADERGEGRGQGYTRNVPLPEGLDDDGYLARLADVLDEVRRFDPAFVVVSVGYDIMKGDPTGGFVLTRAGLQRIGEAFGRLDRPTLLIQEGGYTLRNLRQGARAFCRGLLRAAYRQAA